MSSGNCDFACDGSQVTLASVNRDSSDPSLSRRWQIVKLYVYEAFVLVLSASILGIIIGFLMGQFVSSIVFNSHVIYRMDHGLAASALHTAACALRLPLAIGALGM